MTEPLRMGIIGCGDISYAHGGAAQNFPQKVRFVACCDIRQAAAEKWAARFGAEHAYTDYRQMLAQEKLDGVLVDTWPNQHREHVEASLDAGIKNILCEKALTLTGEDAMAIWQKVKANGAFLMEGFMFRHHPAIRQLERWIACGEIGKVDSLRGCFDAYDAETVAPDDPTRNWRQRKECWGGVPYDHICYPVNAVGHFSQGIPVRAFATGSLSKYETIHRLFAVVEYENGCVATVHASRKSNENQQLEISGATGIFRIPTSWTTPGHATIEKRHVDSWPHLLSDSYTVEQANPYQLQMENFADAARGQVEPVVPLAQSVTNTFVIAALIRSMMEKRPVDMRIPDEVADAVRSFWKGGQP